MDNIKHYYLLQKHIPNFWRGTNRALKQFMRCQKRYSWSDQGISKVLFSVMYLLIIRRIYCTISVTRELKSDYLRCISC